MTKSGALVLAAYSLAALIPCQAYGQESPDAGDPDAAPPREEAPGLRDDVRFSGSIRPRYESLANQFVAGRTGDDEVLNIRTLLKLEVDAGPLTFVGELLDSRLLSGNDGGGASGVVDAIEPIQLYAQWSQRDAFAPAASLRLKAGRFVMDVGSRRLAARSNFGSTVQSFDGVQAAWTSAGDLKVTAFAVRPATRAPSDSSSALDNEIVFNPNLDSILFTALHIDSPLPHGARGEIYMFGLDERDVSNTPSRNRDLLTVGGRLRRQPGPDVLDFDLEYAHQTGTLRVSTSPLDVTDLDHEASMLHAEIGHTFDMAWSPRLSLLYDFASGDESPLDARSGRFDSLFGDRSFELGPTGIWGALSRNNLSSAGVRLEVEPDSESDALVMVRHVELAEASDRFGNSGVIDPTSASGKEVGQQLEFRYRRWLAKDALRLAVGGAALFEGSFLKDAPNATGQGNAYYGYTELIWLF